jgi:hypothetical protein
MIDLLSDLADADPWYEDLAVWRYASTAYWWQTSAPSYGWPATSRSDSASASTACASRPTPARSRPLAGDSYSCYRTFPA